MNIKSIFKILPSNIAHAHCDIPCGIYDPFLIQRAAHTILRMTNLLLELNKGNELLQNHSVSRMTHVKEEHASILEEELCTLRDDYFKDEHYAKYANLKDLFVNTIKSISKARQSIDQKSSEELLSQILEISEIFYGTKGLESVRVKSIYPTEGEFVVYK